jgi:hypothetical protein
VAIGTRVKRDWLGGDPPDGADNSVHAALDGVVGSGHRVEDDLGEWGGMKRALRRRSGDDGSPEAGEHRGNVWMREDGLHLDRLLFDGRLPASRRPGRARPQRPGSEPESSSA